MFHFPYSGNKNPNWLLFFRGVGWKTTNQINPQMVVSITFRHHLGSQRELGQVREAQESREQALRRFEPLRYALWDGIIGYQRLQPAGISEHQWECWKNIDACVSLSSSNVHVLFFWILPHVTIYFNHLWALNSWASWLAGLLDMRDPDVDVIEGMAQKHAKMTCI